MEIKFLGHASFRLSTRSVSLVTDPFDQKMVGLKFPKVSANIVTISHAHSDHNQVEQVLGDKVVLAGPGEYEIKGVRISGIASYHDDKKGSQRGKNTIYSISIQWVTLVHCGDLGHKLEDNQVEELSNVDVLFIPVGGYYTIGSKLAAAVVTQLEPKIVIPMHYRQEGLNSELFNRLEPVDNFLKELGKEAISNEGKLVLTKDSLPQELQVVTFKVTAQSS